MKRQKRGIIYICLFLLMGIFMTGCEKQEEHQGKNLYQIYYLNRDETRIEPQEYFTDTEDSGKLIEELIEVMTTIPDDVGFHEPVHNFSIVGYNLLDHQLTIDVDEKYRSMSVTTEVLTRAAIVRTLTQIPGIKYVTMRVNQEELTDNLGNAVGMMSAEQFLDNTGKEINSYEKAKLVLYFTSKDGKQLVKANRTVVYNSNISMEKLVVEQLIGGPSSDEIYPTLNPNTKIVNVTVKDGICYVNLDESFLEQQSNVTPQVALYSLVNSLVELQNVNKVQISINGETDLVFRETFNLKTVFERNLDIL